MVVHFASDGPSDSSPADERHPVKKKYLVARTRERKSSIFDYVHLSSSLLRKVRYGQSLDAALQSKSPWSGSTTSPSAFHDLRDSSAAPSAVSIWRKLNDVPMAAASPVRRKASSTTAPPPGVKASLSDNVIRYGRQIQLQATDGGFLAVDTDGVLVKLPQSHRGDPSTMLTLFPQDPLQAPSRSAHVCTDELCFIVLGAATITSDHELRYVHSRRMRAPPAALRHAVDHQQQQHRHRGDRDDSTQREVLMPRARGVLQQPTVWSFRLTSVPRARELLQNGMVVQLTQGELTMHYEMERIVKKKYKPIATSGPETDEPASPNGSPTASGVDGEVDANTPQSQGVTHVWLQRNDVSSQHDPQASHSSVLKPKLWDNLWFLVDVATDRKQERDRKQQQAVLEAERDSELRNAVDERHEHDRGRGDVKPLQRVVKSMSEEESSTWVGNNGPDERDSNATSKRLSVLNARAFVGQAAEEAQRHAAAIIVRFLRRVFRREAERRANDLIDRRIRRTGKHRHRYGEVDECTLSTTQQLQILQCFKPTVFGSQRMMEPRGTESRRIPGVSLQGSKYPRQETHRLATMDRDLRYLGSNNFQQQHVTLQHPCRLPPHQYHEGQSHALHLRAKQMSRERDRDHKIHVQLAMAHQEKPPFRFGKAHLRLQAHQRPQTAPASPISKP